MAEIWSLNLLFESRLEIMITLWCSTDCECHVEIVYIK
jgi:hypothetical protein